MQLFRFFQFFSFGCNFILSLQAVHGEDINTWNDRANSETNDEIAAQLFKKFVNTHERMYLNDSEEYNRRLAIFKESLARQAKLNAREKELNGTAVYGINQFSDWTVQEFKGFLVGGITRDHAIITNSIQPQICKLCHLQINASATPSRQDWGKRGKVTSVKNQGKCGSCWAFSAAECVESQWAIAGNPLTELSVQELISCVRKDGCSGGNTYEALYWLQKGDYPLVSASELPYVDKETTCNRDTLSEKGAKIRCGCELVMGNKTEVYMKEIIGLHGPMAVNVDATMWHDYLGGIIQHHCTDTDINHAVQITGYDYNDYLSYWIVRNSWGSRFGENGYLYIKMGENLCGVAEAPSFVVV
ncbi:cathepsin O-like [Acropora palmata]|uniref:cathepsin O-like n=1 Tax=Acropora palmata TaxID=6131 RepID=UPI003DA0D1EA